MIDSIRHQPLISWDAQSLCNILKQDQQAELFRAVDLIIWDEVLMQSHFTHEALDCTMRVRECTPCSGHHPRGVRV